MCFLLYLQSSLHKDNPGFYIIRWHLSQNQDRYKMFNKITSTAQKCQKQLNLRLKFNDSHKMLLHMHKVECNTLSLFSIYVNVVVHPNMPLIDRYVFERQ